MSYFPQLAESFSELLAEIADQRVLVLGHARPDGDCIGSQVALTRMLRQNGSDALALNYDSVPEALSFLDGDIRVDALSENLLDNCPLLFVDCADERRVGFDAYPMIADKTFLGNIDHHISNTNYATHNIVDSSSAATCEILTGLAFDLDWEIDADSAQALLTGIMTDTGRFGFPATSKRVFELSGRLVDCGARPHVTSQALYENEPFSRLKLLQRFLATLHTEFNGQLGMGFLLQEDFLDTEATYEQTEGFVDYARGIRGAKIGLYIEERKTTVKVSLRAESSEYRVDLIAKQFGGGGHACAAAFSSDEKMEILKSRILAAISDRLKEVDESI